MQKWEYLIARWHYEKGWDDREELAPIGTVEEGLNHLGDRGWDLAHAQQYTDAVRFYFKRPKDT